MLTILASDWNNLIRDLEDFISDVDDSDFFALIEGKREGILERLRRITSACSRMGLKFSAMYADEIAAYIAHSVSSEEQSEVVLANLNALLQGNYVPPNAQTRIDEKTLLDPHKVKAEIAVLRKRIDHELEGHEFIVLDSRTAPIEIPPSVGRNIDRLRKECGWGFNELAESTGLEKKLILGHVNKGKGIRPKTPKKYADAFTEGLERKVTVAELES